MMGALVDTVGSWVWVAAGLVAVIAGVYGASKWFKAQFREAAIEANEPKFAEMLAKLDHLHDCVERVGAAAKEAAEVATATATEHAAVMQGHIAQDAEEFGQITEWRATTDEKLQRIQDKPPA